MVVLLDVIVGSVDVGQERSFGRLDAELDEDPMTLLVVASRADLVRLMALAESSELLHEGLFVDRFDGIEVSLTGLLPIALGFLLVLTGLLPGSLQGGLPSPLSHGACRSLEGDSVRGAKRVPPIETEALSLSAV